MKTKNILIVISIIIIIGIGFLGYDKIYKTKDIVKKSQIQTEELSKQDVASMGIEEAIKNNDITKLEELIASYGWDKLYLNNVTQISPEAAGVLAR